MGSIYVVAQPQPQLFQAVIVPFPHYVLRLDLREGLMSYSCPLIFPPRGSCNAFCVTIQVGFFGIRVVSFQSFF